MFSIALQDPVVDRLQALPTTVQLALAAKAADLADRLTAHVVQDKLSGQVLRARTGALRASIRAESSFDGDHVRIRVFSSGDVKYAAIQEYGGQTAAHDIVPNKVKALAFVAAGGLVFASRVHHPGSSIPERSYLRSSLADMAEQITGELKSTLTAALGA